jgi:Flp pilus assembly pilin Flp
LTHAVARGAGRRPARAPRLGITSTFAAAEGGSEMQKLFSGLPQREEGQTMAEYGVVLAVITIAVFGALALLSGNIVNAISRVAAYIT